MQNPPWLERIQWFFSEPWERYFEGYLDDLSSVVRSQGTKKLIARYITRGNWQGKGMENYWQGKL